MKRAAKRLLGLLAVLALSSAASFPNAGQGPAEKDDPIVGTWRLNVEQSIFDPGPPPQSQTRTYERTPGGLKATVVTLDATGTASTFEYVAGYETFDPVIGAQNVDAIKLRRVGRNTDEALLRHGSRDVGSLRRVVSEDGKLMTITLRLGDNFTSLRVFEKPQ